MKFIRFEYLLLLVNINILAVCLVLVILSLRFGSLMWFGDLTSIAILVGVSICFILSSIFKVNMELSSRELDWKIVYSNNSSMILSSFNIFPALLTAAMY